MSKYKVESIEHLIQALETNIKTHKHTSISISDNPEYNSGHNEGYTAACEYAIKLTKALQEAQIARLAAAAPELLEKIEKQEKKIHNLLGTVYECHGHLLLDRSLDALEALQQAIAKAEEGS